MATFEQGETSYIIEWQGDHCVVTCLPRLEAVRELLIPRALAPRVAGLLCPELLEACRETLAVLDETPCSKHSPIRRLWQLCGQIVAPLEPPEEGV